MPDVVSCMPVALVAQAAWPGLEKPGGTVSPGPINVISWEGPRGRAADISKIGLFD